MRYAILVTAVDIEFGSKEFDELVPEDKRLPSARAVIRIDIQKTSGSCGYGVPLMQFVEERETLNKWGDGLTRKVPAFANAF